MFRFSLQLSSETSLIVRRVQGNTIINVQMYSCKVPVTTTSSSRSGSMVVLVVMLVIVVVVVVAEVVIVYESEGYYYEPLR